jgi:hypothetical protein
VDVEIVLTGIYVGGYVTVVDGNVFGGVNIDV